MCLRCASRPSRAKWLARCTASSSHSCTRDDGERAPSPTTISTFSVSRASPVPRARRVPRLFGVGRRSRCARRAGSATEAVTGDGGAFSLFAGDRDRRGPSRRSIHALAAARSSGMPARPMRASSRAIHSTSTPAASVVLDLVAGAVELAAGEVGERGDRARASTRASRPVTGGEVVDVHRAEALGARLHRHERAVGVRPEAVLLGGGHGCAGHLSVSAYRHLADDCLPCPSR